MCGLNLPVVSVYDDDYQYSIALLMNLCEKKAYVKPHNHPTIIRIFTHIIQS